MEVLHAFSEWVIAVLEHWHGYVSGTVLAFGLELIKKFREWEPSKRVFAAIVAVGLILSMFATWHEEYEKTHPGLKLSLDEWGFADSVGDNNGKSLINSYGTPSIIIATVRNLGAQSIADDWSLHISLPGKTEVIEARLMDFDLPNQPPIHIEGDTIPLSKILYKQTMTPIVTGDKKRGLLGFFVEGIAKKELAQKGTKITLTCHDVAGNKITSPTVELTGNNEGHRHFIELE